jgi:hypothetical protein
VFELQDREGNMSSPRARIRHPVGILAAHFPAVESHPLSDLCSGFFLDSLTRAYRLLPERPLPALESRQALSSQHLSSDYINLICLQSKIGVHRLHTSLESAAAQRQAQFRKTDVSTG